jgi:predicted anti-sigma-YlaC factor YlaD
MKNEMDLKTDCRTCRTHLADLLLDESYVSAHPEVAEHMAACAECRTELEELQSTFALLDTWTAPEPSAYFDVKLRALLREAQASAPEGLWDRMRSFLLFSTGRHLRPAMAGALAFVLVLGGGGTFVGLYQHPVVATHASPTVNDLKILDNNAQTLQQMDQLLDSSDDDSGPPTT